MASPAQAKGGGSEREKGLIQYRADDRIFPRRCQNVARVAFTVLVCFIRYCGVGADGLVCCGRIADTLESLSGSEKAGEEVG